MIMDPSHSDPRFLLHFPHHGLFEALAGFDETRERGIHVGDGKTGRMGEQSARAPDDQHDHRRIGARKMIGMAGRTVADIPRLPRLEPPPAHAAKAVPPLPVDEPPGMGEDRCSRRGKIGGKSAEVGEPLGLPRQRGHFPLAEIESEDRALFEKAEETHPLCRRWGRKLASLEQHLDRLPFPPPAMTQPP